MWLGAVEMIMFALNSRASLNRFGVTSGQAGGGDLAARQHTHADLRLRRPTL